MKIDLKRESWENLIENIKANGVKCSGNFWAAIQNIERQLEEDYKVVKPQEFRLNENITVDHDGDIIFQDGYAVLHISEDKSHYLVSQRPSILGNCSKDFVWIPCKRENLKPGDTVYLTDTVYDELDDMDNVHKIMNNSKAVYVEYDTDVNVTDGIDYQYYYKLVRRGK